MNDMKPSVKTTIKISLIIIPLVLLACLVLFRSQPDEPVIPNIADTSGVPAFEVRVAVPRLSRPFAGILPDWVVKKFDGTPSELRFDPTSSGAQIVSVGPDRLELKADDWNLLIETDGAGHITPGTHFVFPINVGGRHMKLDCQAADGASNYFNTTPRTGSKDLGGSFGFEIAPCKNAESGKVTNWPSRPLTVRGSFVGQSQQPSMQPKQEPTKPGS
jgi:hypothetical protein